MTEYGNGKGSANENGKRKNKGTINVVIVGKAVNLCAWNPLVNLSVKKCNYRDTKNF